MEVHGPLAFVTSVPGSAAFEVRVNFGIYSGREVTQAEIDRLARTLLSAVPQVAITSLRRHEFDRGHEAAVHQVVVETRAEEAGSDADVLAERVRAAAEAWAADCVAERHVDPIDA